MQKQDKFAASFCSSKEVHGQDTQCELIFHPPKKKKKDYHSWQRNRNWLFQLQIHELCSSFFMEVCWVSWLEEGLSVLQNEFSELSHSMSLAHFYYWPYKFLKRLVQVSSSHGLVLNRQHVSRDFGLTIFLLFNQHSNLNSVAK